MILFAMETVQCSIRMRRIQCNQIEMFIKGVFSSTITGVIFE